MAKRYNTHAVKKHQIYTIEEAAEVVGAHVQTVRSWIKAGLCALSDKKPALIIGDHLQEFLSKKKEGARSLAPNEFYCTRCQEPKTPAGNMADYMATNGITGRLAGICPTCESICNRFVNRQRLGDVAPDLEINFKEGAPSLEEPEKAALKTHLKREH